MTQTSSFAQWMQRYGISALLCLLTFGMIFTSGGFLVSNWRMMKLHHQQHAETLSEIRTFHKHLLHHLQTAVNQSTPHATEDLCQIRFRLRDPDGWGFPLGDYRFDLYQRSAAGAKPIQQLTSDVNMGAIVDFGLTPPGQYRLTITNSWGMTCDHDFRVIPGVPVDRAILCPRRPPWTFHRNSVPVDFQTVWPREWNSQPIIAVYHLQEAPTRLEEWEWRPPEQSRFCRWVVRGNLERPFSEDGICEALPKMLRDKAALPQIEPPESHQFQVPYGSCEVSAVSFLLDRAEMHDGYTYLGTYEFSKPGTTISPLSETDADARPGLLIAQAVPSWEFDMENPTSWEVRFPAPIVEHVLARAEKTLRMPPPAAKGPQQSDFSPIWTAGK